MEACMKAWVAKDKDGMTFLYSKKPKKGDEDWNSSVYTYYPINELPEGIEDRKSVV